MRDQYNKQELQEFKPAFGLANKHIQTLYPVLFRKKIQLKFETERFWLDDGDFVDCFWYGKPERSHKTPIVILFHGLEGSYRSSYIQGMMNTLGKAGFSSVLMHFRGCSGKMNNLPRSYHSGDTNDAKAWITHLDNHYNGHKLFAVGYSLGGNMLLKLLGEWKEESPLAGAVSVSAPMQLEASADRMNRGVSLIYQYYLMKHLKASLLKKYKSHPMESIIGIDENSVKKLKTLREFDDAYTAPVNGFESANEYYKKSSAKQFVKNIRTSTLIIHALDDPFMTNKVLPDQKELPLSVKMELSKNGGHVGFVGGNIFRPKYWLEERILAFIKKLN
ncbi:MAG: hydrolase [Helicobacteraceae bacterium 4484_230]|nr:MAG: hydrolase [Helicobacteraceae bacterium 4484_230]